MFPTTLHVEYGDVVDVDVDAGLGSRPHFGHHEMRLMAERYVSDGMIPEAGDVDRLTTLLGRQLHSYRDFATELLAQQSNAV